MDLDIIEYAPRPTTTIAVRARANEDEIVFGATSVLVGSRGTVSDADVKARRRAVVPATDQLFIVRQKGRLFQRAHPDVEVLVNKGRYLLVRMSAARAAQIRPSEEPCFRIEPAAGGRIVFERVTAPAMPAAQVEAARAALSGLSPDVFSGTLAELVSLPTRLSTSQGYIAAIEQCRARLHALDYSTAIDTLPIAGGDTRNLIARASGATRPPRVIVTAHLDSVNHDAGPDAPAPGADDNGSGSAGVIALADALASAGRAADVLFVLFGGEEQGLHGSKAFVTARKHFDPAALSAVINMDMIGSINPPEDPTVTRLAVLIEGAEVSRELVSALAQAAATHTRLEVATSFEPFASDHVPFITAGIPAVLTIEGEDSTNRFIHSGDDRIDHIDTVLAMEILKMNLACIVGFVGGSP
jgi:peptidase M28-like protein